MFRFASSRGILVSMTNVTRILARMESGDAGSAEQLLPLVHDELRKLAATRLTHENWANAAGHGFGA